jgi:hypothetical protein
MTPTFLMRKLSKQHILKNSSISKGWHFAYLLIIQKQINSPGAFIWTGGSRKSEPSRLSDRCLSSVEGRSLILSDIWRLNGEAWFNCWNPRNEPWRCSMDIVACGLSMAYGLNTGFTGGGSDTERHQ